MGKSSIHLWSDHHRVYLREGTPGVVIRRVDQLLSYSKRSDIYLARRLGYAVPVQRLLDWNTLSFPKGLTHRVVCALERDGFEVELEEGMLRPITRSFPMGDWVYPHQRRAVEHMLRHPHSTVQAPTGSGKTVIAALVLGHIRGLCLVVVPTKDLLRQTAERLHSILGEPIGMLGDGMRRWERVNVGIINTLVGIAETEEGRPLRMVEAVVYDEAHRAVQVNRYGQLTTYLESAYFQWGLTAGAERQDGQELAMEAVIGPTLLVISERETESLRLTLKPRVIFVQFTNPSYVYPGAKRQGRYYIYPTPNGKPDQMDVYRQAVVNCPKRNQLVEDVVRAYCSCHRAPALVLVESIEHGEELSRRLQAPFVHGKWKRRDREENLEKMRRGEIPVTVATKVYTEGVDIPNLGLVVNASAERSQQAVRQKIGRGVRQAPGKEQVYYVDILDSEPYYLRSRAQQRLQTARNLYPGSVTIHSPEELCHVFLR